jgi:hypothetical protein
MARPEEVPVRVVERVQRAHAVTPPTRQRGDVVAGAAAGAGNDEQRHRGVPAESTRRTALPATRRSRSACMA